MDLRDKFEALFDKLDEYIENPVELIVYGGCAVYFYGCKDRKYEDIDVIGNLPLIEQDYIRFIGKEVLGAPLRWLDFRYDVPHAKILTEDHEKRAVAILYKGQKLTVKLGNKEDLISAIKMGFWHDAYRPERAKKALRDLNALGVTAEEALAFKEEFKKRLGVGYETMANSYEEKLKKII